MAWPIKYEFWEGSHCWYGRGIRSWYDPKFHGKYYIPVIYRVLVFSLFYQRCLTLQYYWRKLKGNKSIKIGPFPDKGYFPCI